MRTRALCLIAVMLTAQFSPAQAVPPAADSSQSQTAGAAPKQLSAAQISAAVKSSCNFSDTETNRKKVEKMVRCMQKAQDAYRERLLIERSLNTTAARMAAMASQSNENATAGTQMAAALAPVQPSNAPANQDAIGGAQIMNAASLPYVGGSASSTPTTCGTGSGKPQNTLIRVHRQVMTPDTAMDDFGYRLGKRFVVYQVTVENLSADSQYMLEDVSIDFSSLFPKTLPGTYRFTASGQDLTLLRGVPEKGQDLDPRNRVLHIFQGIGSVAAGISGLTPFSDVMGGAVAQFNGPFLGAYGTLLPDHTATQLNRLSDSAFMANTVINKHSAKTIAMFIPLDEVMNHNEKKDFFSDPYEYVGLVGGSNLLYSADVCVDGVFVQPTVPKPTLTEAVVPKNPNLSIQVTVKLTGSNFQQGDTQVVLGTGSAAVTGAVITTDGQSGTATMTLPSDYKLGTTTAFVQSSSNPTINSGTPIKITEQP